MPVSPMDSARRAAAPIPSWGVPRRDVLIQRIKARDRRDPGRLAGRQPRREAAARPFDGDDGAEDDDEDGHDGAGDAQPAV